MGTLRCSHGASPASPARRRRLDGSLRQASTGPGHLSGPRFYRLPPTQPNARVDYSAFGKRPSRHAPPTSGDTGGGKPVHPQLTRAQVGLLPLWIANLKRRSLSGRHDIQYHVMWSKDRSSAGTAPRSMCCSAWSPNAQVATRSALSWATTARTYCSRGAKPACMRSRLRERPDQKETRPTFPESRVGARRCGTSWAPYLIELSQSE